jgi:geranylgeranyl reductase family protein
VRADVVVIGAGPAGSAAAATLAAGGARVVLADKAAFPRDKICGDGLLPDALAALAALGAADGVRAAAHPVSWLRLRGAASGTVRLPLAGLVVRRHTLDALLVEHARRAGAEVLSGAALTGLDAGPGGFAAARMATAAGEVAIAAGAFVLATGAARRPRELAGLGEGKPRSAVALRGYARLAGLPDDELLVDLRSDLAGGYAWAFGVGDGLWNVGCGLPHDSRRTASLGKSLERFLRELGGAEWVTPPRGAPLLTAFPRMPFTRANLAAVGDAAGLTRPFSGEGIGPSLWSGVAIAESLLAQPRARGVDAYRRRMVRRYRRDFAAWRLGELFLNYPRLGEWLIAKAQHPGAQRRLAAMLADTLPAERVLSPWGLVRLLIRR